MNKLMHCYYLMTSNLDYNIRQSHTRNRVNISRNDHYFAKMVDRFVLYREEIKNGWVPISQSTKIKVSSIGVCIYVRSKKRYDKLRVMRGRKKNQKKLVLCGNVKDAQENYKTQLLESNKCLSNSYGDGTFVPNNGCRKISCSYLDGSS